MICLECEHEFHGARWTQRYCSDECRTIAKKRRKSEKNQRYHNKTTGKPVVVRLPDDELRRVLLPDGAKTIPATGRHG